MPPANTGSKAALVTWTVIATVFGIVMTVLAILAYANANRAEDSLASLERSYNEVLPRPELTGTRVGDLKAAFQAENRTGPVLNNVLNRESDLAQRAAGVSDAVAAINTMQAKLQGLAQMQPPVSAATLTGAVDQLQARLATLQQENQVLEQTNEEVRTALAQARTTAEQQIAQKDQQIAQLSQQVQETTANFSVFQQSATSVESTVQQEMQRIAEAAAEAQQQLQDRLTTAQDQAQSRERQVETVTNILRSRFRGDQMLTSSDGEVLRSPSEGRLFINLGRNNSVTNGMTFEVYDQVRGIPQMESEDSLPKGKASIQVIRVLPASAEARIIRNEPGQVVREGDLIANLAYDPNVPVRFRVYGEFDLDNNDRTDPRDRDRIESLIREFGGRVVPEITVETDLLVIGKEPAITNYSDEELRDPRITDLAFQERQRSEQYQDLLAQARSFNIPILNQNQFLYYIGYFDQSQR